MPSNITGVIARVVVDDLDAAIPLYQGLAGVEQVQRFGFGEVELASVGPFLLLAGNTAPYANRVATLLVRDLGPVLAELDRAGGEILDGPAPGPNGDRLIARNPDGAVFEYIQVAA
jgi:predicted enzyme related to lactoylglutathione lyase